MPAPSTATYSAAALVAAHTSFRDLIDSGSAAGTCKIRSSSDTLLASIPLADPCGTVNGTTGQLTFNVTAAEDASADASGTAAYAEFCDSDGDVHLSLPTELSSSPVSGKFAMSTLTIVAGGPVALVSATVG
jgi:hypothetical protein